MWLLGAGAVGAAIASQWDRIPQNVLRQYWREMGRPVLDPGRRPDPRRWPDTGLHAAWLGHATVLLKIDGYTVLTDPVFSTRIGLGLGPIVVGLKRLVAPALVREQLPPVDLILLSHAHMDHLDIPSLRDLENKSVEVITARATSDLLRVNRYKRVQEVGWDEEVRCGPLTLRGVRVNHWGAPMRSDTWRGYNGYVIQSGKRRVLFGGDTAITGDFRSVGKVDLAIMPIGAYNPWRRFHCTPEEAWRMAQDARAEFVLPVHHQTFALSREPFFEPIERLQEAAGRHAQRVTVRHIGDEWAV
jgi:L-ascorbate metabolism protein UlaG (beta-lactamase superfamily)